MLVLLVSPGCGDDSERVIAAESYSDTFVAEPSAELLEIGKSFPDSLRIQILNGNAFGSFPANDSAALQCPPTDMFSAFAHRWSVPPTCDGYRSASSPLVQQAEREATSFISGITCPAGCTRTQSITWRAWACGHAQDSTLNYASGMAVSTVTCTAP
ncbi:hypothetical protein GQ464_004830 [Rhodocaloribacter litoris]|uniref:hypothetical protein n=1 Tax=Rhodocaloribacter litoris TaxID=2558931 RepID=UPI00141DB090|nr:hypothetical protein [Rhodocaloribacter litoris]QXD16282.1 hypothetical protein GQ464_004830 [Rhodocaloribacter litoris]